MRDGKFEGKGKSSRGDPEKNKGIKSCESILWGGRESKVRSGEWGGFTSTRAGLHVGTAGVGVRSRCCRDRRKKKLSSSTRELTLAHESGDAQGSKGGGKELTVRLRVISVPATVPPYKYIVSTPTSIFRQEEAWSKNFLPVSNAGAPSQLGRSPGAPFLPIWL